MAEKQILSLKPAPRLEQVGDEHSERVQDRKHRSQGCDDSALRCESRPDGIFGKDSLTVNQVELMEIDNVAARPDMTRLGINPTSVVDCLHHILAR